MDWKKYDDDALKKKINENNEELIKRWESARRDAETRLKEMKFLYKEIREKDEQIKLLTENLEEHQSKLFATEK